MGRSFIDLGDYSDTEDVDYDALPGTAVRTVNIVNLLRVYLPSVPPAHRKRISSEVIRA